MNVKECKCSVCENNAVSMFGGKPYCNKHWLRLYNNGTTDKIKRKTTNTYITHDNYVEIITKKNETILVDLDDFDKVKDFSWCVSSQGYAVANIGGIVRKINWVIYPKIKHFVQDHINGNKLDNRKCNLRNCTSHENSLNCGNTQNRVMPKGIRKTKSGKYNVRIMFNRKEHHLGNYDTLEKAIEVRKEAENKYFGDYARK